MADGDGSLVNAQQPQPGAEALAQQLTTLLRQYSQPNTDNRSTETNQGQTVTVSIKLNEFNYSLWSRMMHLAIGGRGCLNHITGLPPSPNPTDPNYTKWYQNDLTVISWIVQNMEPTLASNYVQYKTAESLWRGLTTTYGIKRDSAQIFELTVQANSIKQGQGTIENFYSILQRIWAEIDESHPNPMDCEKDIETYRKLQSETRLFQLLAGVNEGYKSERRDILKLDPLPNVETAYALIRRGAARRGIWRPEPEGVVDRETGSGFMAQQDSEARGMAANGYRPSNQSGQPLKHSGNGGSSSRDKINKNKLKCTHCGITKHTKETCFRLVGYPKWWEDNHKPPKENHGKAAVATGNSEVADAKTTSDGGRGS